jgi:ABC-type transporter Mla subunit MlaD
MSRYAVLVGRIERDLEDLEQLANKTNLLIEKVRATADTDYLGTVALNLHSFYSGTERIFRDIALEIDSSLPEGSDWHRRLLRQMLADIPDVRPKLLSDRTFKMLNELCAFRQFLAALNGS